MFLKFNTFDVDKSNEIKTSIQIGLDGFSFSRFNLYENRLIEFSFAPLHISSHQFVAQRVEEWLEFNKKSIKLWGEIRLIISDHFTLVPESFIPENKEAYFSSLFETNPENKIVEQEVKNTGLHILFLIPSGLTEVFEKRKIETTLKHPVKLLIENLPLPKNDKDVILYFNSKDFSYILLDNQGIRLVNNFRYNHPNDVLFYLMTINKQLKINSAETKIFLSGDIIEHDENYNQIIKLFPDIEFIEADPAVTIAPGIFGYPTHRFITHFFD